MINRTETPPASVPVRQNDLLAVRKVRGFRFTESHHEGFIPPHTHEHPTVTVVLGGLFEETYGRGRVTCEPSSVLLRPASQSHADLCGRTGVTNFVIEIEAERARSIGEFTNVLEELVHLRDLRLLELTRRMNAELKAADDASDLVLEGLALEFIALVIRREQELEGKGAPPRWLRQSQALIRDRFCDLGIQISDLAEEAGVHPVHYSRAFKAFYGTTPGTYLRTLRVEWAAEQLQSSPLSIAEIALEAGFSDQSHFGRAFKRHFGHPPGAWRRRGDGGAV